MGLYFEAIVPRSIRVGIGFSRSNGVWHRVSEGETICTEEPKSSASRVTVELQFWLLRGSRLPSRIEPGPADFLTPTSNRLSVLALNAHWVMMLWEPSKQLGFGASWPASIRLPRICCSGWLCRSVLPSPALKSVVALPNHDHKQPSTAFAIPVPRTCGLSAW